MSKISEMLLKLEGFQYAMSLYLNLKYSHILLRKNASSLCTIILLRGKYQYKHLSMGVTNSTNIFQHKMNDSFHGFEFICAYIYDLLIFIKGYWTYHVQKL